MHVKTTTAQGDYLRDGVNVEIDNTGRLLRRKKATLVQALTGPHSLYMLDEMNGYLVRESVLYSITLSTYSEAVVKLLASNDAMSYVEYNGDLYYSNGTDSGRIKAGTVYPIGLTTPDTPTVSVIGGSLLPGWYQIAVAYTNATTGEEGGVCASANIEFNTTGGIRAPPAATTGATHINVHPLQRTVKCRYLATTVPAGTALVDLIALSSGSWRCAALRRTAASGAAVHEQRAPRALYKGNTLCVGLPYRHGYYKPAEGYAVHDGHQRGTRRKLISVAADKTYWIPNEGPIADVLPYGAVSGTAFSYPDKSIYGWFGEKGIVIGSPSGEVEAVMSDND